MHDFIYKPHDEKYFPSVGITLSLLLELEEIGIVQTGGGFGPLEGLQKQFNSRSKDKFLAILVYYNEVLVAEKDEKDVTLDLPVYLLTKVGREIMPLGKFTGDPTYLPIIGKEIQTKGFSVKIGNIARWIPNSTLFEYGNLRDI